MMIWLWLASALGAALFFTAGWLAGRGQPAPLVTTAPPPRPEPPAPPSLEPQLAALRQQLAGSQTQQRHDRSALEQATHDLGAARAQVERLRIDLMRAQKQSRDLESEHHVSSTELGAARGQLAKLREELSTTRQAQRAPRAPLQVRAAGHNAGDVLQALVDGVSGSAEIRCAVVADDLGLVVASHGELGDEVAAVGALFGRAGLQAQKVLPLHKVQRVTVEDDQNVTLTLRPLMTDGSMEGELALITLAVGATNERASGPARSARPT
jgi:hypothetical protein